MSNDVQNLRNNISQSDLNKGRTKCELCGKRVHNTWTVVVEGVMCHSSEQIPISYQKQFCITCATLAEERGHTVIRVPTTSDPTVTRDNVRRFPVRAVAAGGSS